MLRSSSFLNRTVCTPEMAFTTVDFPCATWPMVPIFVVACLAMMTGDIAVRDLTSRSCGSGCSGKGGLETSGGGSGLDFFNADFN